ncbi:3-deoxy-manno-octulosonate cytidylyltransferase [Coxiella burnetii]|nr:3-deoxy-manno-octulosonate cytidylyltransferase [Coxiella burnetii]AZV76193.1 3-deoxy-manno-octulosonate cytidylyltransferase [Coxiella burnetii]MDE3401375.1 3-deoxy-manno-octulosonate cytidylyltransferase [Coxiella burnetii]OYK92082.1 3-deoxy-manno-octulosonate cytidylyltransferase [Coxiella burnetii]PNT80049.1 3-deoxy-manno-octulosonate cytidylyltransferase [Coxiella burnetii]PNT81510.1 3-deoxy-manno-octulosonate cytidylyltransferase [Coxiella burnetii]
MRGKMEFRVIIPARFDSTRLPGKALVDIAGKPMIQHVYESAIKSGAEEVVIATDDKRIRQVAEDFGAVVCMTSSDHQSGTERIAEAAVALGFEDDEIIVCLQGDEPLIPPDAIRKLAEDLDEHDNVKVASLCTPITEVDELFNPHSTKVVLNRRNYALYFSHAPIPWGRDTFSDKENLQLNGSHYCHVGIYAYRVGFLEEYLSWDACPAEKMEALEQLRILWHGGRIHMVVAKSKCPPGVDTEEDLERVRAYF